MRLFFCNVPVEDCTEPTIRQCFEQMGEVESVTILRYNDTGHAKGHGFVEMPNRDEALQVIEQLSGQKWGARTFHVEPARPRAERLTR